jgi:glyoxylate reductase
MLSPSIAGVVDEEIVSVLPKSLKYICHCGKEPGSEYSLVLLLEFLRESMLNSSFLGSGYDQVSIPACTSRRILVSNTPDVVNEATADATIFLMLGALRNFNPGIATLRDRRWRGQPPIGIGHDPQGKTLGILGMGGIGRNVMAKAEAFGMKVQYSNRNKLPDGLSGGAKFVSFEELLATSDVISTNLPMNVSTCLAVFNLFPPWRIKLSCQ